MVVKDENINSENVVLTAEFNVRMVGEMQHLLPHVSCKVWDHVRGFQPLKTSQAPQTHFSNHDPVSLVRRSTFFKIKKCSDSRVSITCDSEVPSSHLISQVSNRAILKKSDNTRKT